MSQSIRSDLAEEVVHGLTARPMRLSPKFLYDDVGSALFEVITLMPEYLVTKSEMRLLQTYAGQIAAHTDANTVVCELGGGRGAKARFILSAMVEAFDGVTYFPVDISEWALDETVRGLESLGGVETRPIQASYLDGLKRIESEIGDQRLLVLFLGSNIGNFEASARDRLLRDLSDCLKPGDKLLLGVDLVKSEAVLRDAYDDPVGVTSAFNKNLLARLNREFGGNIDIRAFEHQARWNPDHSRMEMSLLCHRAHSVRFSGLDLKLEFKQGDRILTEYSYKFTKPQIEAIASALDFVVDHLWVEEQGLFCEALLEKSGR